MKNLSIAIALLGPLVAASAVHAAEGWKMPNMNPFAKKSSPPTSARVSDSGGGWKMPKLWPSSGKPAARKGPSTWQKMTSGTKSMMSKTADVLNPFDDENDNPPPVEITGSNTYFSQAANRKQAEKKSSTFLPSWWSGEEEEQKPKTVSDFLALPRPGFYE
jgi:hypothetical protein